MSQDRTGPVVHVRENSDTELEALFNIAMNPQLASETNKSVPLRMRNLPASFFRPPEPPKVNMQQQQIGKDSLNSTDAHGFHGAVNSTMNIAHMRAHSSPASLQQSLSAAPPPPPTSHVRQHSYDLLDEQPLPTGWDMAKNAQGQRYYLNHVLQITTWNDPRKTHTPGTIPLAAATTNNNNNNASNLNSCPQTGSTSPSGQPAAPNSPPINVGKAALAPGWEKAALPPGWEKVALAPGWEKVALAPGWEKVALPPGWEKAYTADLEVYFINHVHRTTSWFHPSIPAQMQRPGMKFQQQQEQQQQQQSVPSSPMSPQQDQLKHLKLQQLQMEQERLKKRQDEIARQEMALRAGGDITAISQSSEMTSVTDPFFGQNTTSDHHRQESGDSGLGGMGTSYSLPRTPDDFLGNMEDMDTGEGAPPGQAGLGSMDMTGVNDVSDHLNMTGVNDHLDMDSEDLVASLQEEINSDLLKDVDAVLGNKENPLTWL